MLMKKNHSFHMVDQSPWPIMTALAIFILTSGMSNWFHSNSKSLMIIGLTLTSFTVFQWWRDITRESTFQGLHTFVVTHGLRWGMILFITSEIFFFISFFWGFFHSNLSPTLEIGVIWPPMGVTPFSATQVPLLNTIILLSSGVTITWAHHALMENNFTQSKQAILFTMIMGVYFTTLQALEYIEASFTISDSVYGASFFMTTGFHGLHVMIGTIFIFMSGYRLILGHYSTNHHFGFEAAAWYWHFVDVVWLFLYLALYWWGS